MYPNANTFRPSVPVNKRPIIVSSGYPAGHVEMWTRHVFVETRKEPDPNFGELRPEWRHYFRCLETNAVRVFGVEGPNYTEEN